MCCGIKKTQNKKRVIESAVGPGAGAHGCIQEAEARGSVEPRSSRPAWPHSETLSKKKKWCNG